MMEVVKFVIANADKLTVVTLETLLIVGFIFLLIYVFKYIMKMVEQEKTYLMSQVAERNATIQEMTKVLLESQEVMSGLTNAVENNKKDIIADFENKLLSLKNDIQKVIIDSMKGDK